MTDAYSYKPREMDIWHLKNQTLSTEEVFEFRWEENSITSITQENSITFEPELTDCLSVVPNYFEQPSVWPSVIDDNMTLESNIIESTIPNSTSESFLDLSGRRLEFLKSSCNDPLTPYFQTSLTLAKNSLSQHVRIEALSTTITLCRKVAFDELTLSSNQKMFCAGSGAFSLIGTLSLTNMIEKHLGSVAEAAFDSAAMAAVYAFNIYAPQYVNKFSQTSLIKGVAGGQIIRQGLVQILGPVQAAATALDLALNDLMVSTISVGVSNSYANYMAGGYGGSFFDTAQTTYRMLDIPLNYLLTMATNSCSFMTNSLLTVGALAARAHTRDYAPNKVPLEILGIAGGLFLGAIAFIQLPGWRSSSNEKTLNQGNSPKKESAQRPEKNNEDQENFSFACLAGDIGDICDVQEL